MKRSRELGMQTFDQALFELYEANLVTLRGRAAQRRLGQRPAAADQAQEPARAQPDLAAGTEHMQIVGDPQAELALAPRRRATDPRPQ
jgi:twitching motility protein PilU